MKELSVQKYLRDHNMDFEQLKSTYGIGYVFHESDRRVILNYSQIDSKKDCKLVEETRGLVLDRITGQVIARAFNRFYNWGEISRIDKQFDFNNCTATHKEDGSIILVYWYNGQFHVNTRGSFGTGEVCEGMTWRNLFNLAFDNKKLDKLDRDHTYVFELCSRYNKVVRDYPEPKVYLLSVYNNKFGVEHFDSMTDSWAETLEVERPKYVACKDILDAEKYIAEQETADKTFEGLVLRDMNNLRVKLKSASYVALHRLSNNHKLTLERAWDIIIKGEESEFLVYFPELREIFDKVKRIRIDMQQGFTALYQSAEGVDSQKEFAIMVKDSPYAAACFAMRKYGVVENETWFRIFERIYASEDALSN